MNIPLYHVMTSCPEKRTGIRTHHQAMTRAQFQEWIGRNPAPTHVDCPACGGTHLVIAEDYFLEGDQPPS